MINDLSGERIGWADARKKLRLIDEQIEYDWNSFVGGLDKAELEFFNDVLINEYPGVETVIADLDGHLASRNMSAFQNYVVSELDAKIDPFFNSVRASTAEQQLQSQNVAAKIAGFHATARRNMMIMATIGVTLLALLSSVIVRSITRPVRVLSETVSGLSEGNEDVRTNLKGSDELQQLGQALDKLLDDRASTMVSTQEENDQLNDSVMDLLEGVTDLSDRDLTVKLAVRSDITGTVADAINNMTDQTASVLSLVNNVASEVDRASDTVDKQATTVTKVASAQRDVIEDTMKMLDGVSTNMESVSNIATECNTAAGTASRMTDNAMETVQNTVKGRSGSVRDRTKSRKS